MFRKFIDPLSKKNTVLIPILKSARRSPTILRHRINISFLGHANNDSRIRNVKNICVLIGQSAYVFVYVYISVFFVVVPGHSIPKMIVKMAKTTFS